MGLDFIYRILKTWNKNNYLCNIQEEDMIATQAYSMETEATPRRTTPPDQGKKPQTVVTLAYTMDEESESDAQKIQAARKKSLEDKIDTVPESQVATQTFTPEPDRPKIDLGAATLAYNDDEEEQQQGALRTSAIFDEPTQIVGGLDGDEDNVPTQVLAADDEAPTQVMLDDDAPTQTFGDSQGPTLAVQATPSPQAGISHGPGQGQGRSSTASDTVDVVADTQVLGDEAATQVLGDEAATQVLGYKGVTRTPTLVVCSDPKTARSKPKQTQSSHIDHEATTPMLGQEEATQVVGVLEDEATQVLQVVDNTPLLPVSRTPPAIGRIKPPICNIHVEATQVMAADPDMTQTFGEDDIPTLAIETTPESLTGRTKKVTGLATPEAATQVLGVDDNDEETAPTQVFETEADNEGFLIPALRGPAKKKKGKAKTKRVRVSFLYFST